MPTLEAKINENLPQKKKEKKEMFENCDECIYDLVQLR